MRPVGNIGKLSLETETEEIKYTYIEQTARVQIIFLEDHPDCTRAICIYERVGVDEAIIHAVGFWFSAIYCKANRFHFLILLRHEMIVWSSDCDVVSWTPSILCMSDVVHDVPLDVSAITQSGAEDTRSKKDVQLLHDCHGSNTHNQHQPV